MSDEPARQPDPHDDVAADESRDLAVLAAQVADDKKATDINVFDVGDVLAITGWFVVAGASNPRLVRTVVDSIEEQIKAQLGRAPIRTEGVREQQWILMDYGDVVVHVFLDEIREFYGIERLYGDVPRIAWEPPPSL
jgi:ribosome-associated protein